MKIVVAHPGSQHAHQLAWGLHIKGHLEVFYSGVPVVDSSLKKSWLPGFLTKRIRSAPIPISKRRHIVVFPILRRLIATRYVSAVIDSRKWHSRLDNLYDWLIARCVRRIKPDMVVCYENSALFTFRAARDVGAICVLDAASIHYSSASALLSHDRVSIDDEINIRKSLEIDLADAILTCSQFAAETYFSNGVPHSKVFPVPLGTDLAERPLAPEGGGRAKKFLFVGSLRRLKGVDLLCDIFDEFWCDNLDVHLTVVGSIVDVDLGNRVRFLSKPNLSYLPFMARDDLFREMAKHDCLILPSRFDSFGMVVAEAMAVGVPAIVSERVGAKCIIERFPDAGWVVACEKDALKAQILKVFVDPDCLKVARSAACLAAREYSWDAYRQRAVLALEGIYHSAKKSPR